MKILYALDHSFPIESGYSIRSFHALKVLKNLGHEVDVVTTSVKCNCETELIDDITHYRINPAKNILIKLFLKIPLLNRFFRILYIHLKTKKIASNKDYDIFHANSPYIVAIPIYLTSKYYKSIFIYEVRGLWYESSRSSGKNNLISYSLDKLLENYAIKKADQVLSISNSFKKHLIQNGIKENKISVVSNGVDSSSIKKEIVNSKFKKIQEKYLFNNSIILGYITNIRKMEGLEVLIDSIKYLDNYDVKIMIVGDGEDKTRLEKLAKTKKLQNKVIFTGKVPHLDIGYYYKIIDIFIIPRISFKVTELITPLKPLEAMAYKKPIIASDVGGLRELIIDSENGILFKNGDSHDLAEKIKFLLNDVDFTSELKINAEKYVISKHSWNKVLSDPYKKVYEKVTEQKNIN